MALRIIRFLLVDLRVVKLNISQIHLSKILNIRHLQGKSF